MMLPRVLVEPLVEFELPELPLRFASSLLTNDEIIDCSEAACVEDAVPEDEVPAVRLLSRL